MQVQHLQDPDLKTSCLGEHAFDIGKGKPSRKMASLFSSQTNKRMIINWNMLEKTPVFQTSDLYSTNYVVNQMVSLG